TIKVTDDSRLLAGPSPGRISTSPRNAFVDGWHVARRRRAADGGGIGVAGRTDRVQAGTAGVEVHSAQGSGGPGFSFRRPRGGRAETAHPRGDRPGRDGGRERLVLFQDRQQ